MKTRFLAFSLLAATLSLTACAPATQQAASSAKPPMTTTSSLLTFQGRCDGSAAAWVRGNYLITASDETDDATKENTLAIYDSRRNGIAIKSLAMNDALGFPPDAKRSEKEADIEAAARVGNRIFWIGSHSQSKAKDDKPSEERPARYQFFATGVSPTGVQALGHSYHRLKADMLADARLAPLLTKAATKDPEAKGGWNIEGMSATPDNKLLLGFRNPIVNGKALLVPLLNPDAVVTTGATAKFGAPILLDVSEGNKKWGEERGIRDIVWWATRKCYVVLVGSYLPGEKSKAPFALFLWDGKSTPKRIAASLDSLHTPEAVFVQPNNASQILILSDDGNIDACKEKPDAQRSFTGKWIAVR